jgi:hypothetical protein
MPDKFIPFPCPACGEWQIYLLPPDQDAPGRHWVCMTCGVWGVNFRGAIAWTDPSGTIGKAICGTN